MRQIVLAAVALVGIVACGGAPVAKSGQVAQAVAAPQFSNIEVVRKLPHSSLSYTQGLLIAEGRVYESLGEYGRSALRIVDIETGKIVNETKLADNYFGEGLALIGDTLYQLTWMEGFCFMYDARTLKKIGQHRYSGEGWGLVAAGDSLLMSDGSSVVRVIDPKTFQTTRMINVRDDRGAVNLLNELEMIDGKLWANVYTSPLIAVIDPISGIVERYVDCSPLFALIGNSDSADVLNGIAYDAVDQRLYLTGKLWDTLFEVKIK